MVIKFQCPGCAKQYQVPDKFSGKKARCNCGNVCRVPPPVSAIAEVAAGSGPGLLDKVRGLIRKGQDVYETALQQAYAASAAEVIPIGESLVLGRDPDRCQYVLNHARVSRQHVRIQRSVPGVLVKDLGSADGTYVNGGRVLSATLLNTGDRLNVGPYAFTFDGDALLASAGANRAEIICSRLSREVVDRSTGELVKILNDVSVLVKPCEFTVIIGPSGGGKSTLLNALSGRQPATHGMVLLNGQNLYTHFDALKRNMALVPQKDVLHQQLGLRNALLYTAKLRLPPDLGQEDCEAVVDAYLRTVDLQHREDTRIRDLSGGQVKRASLANEIISEPNLLFVDEATSGLDEHTDGEIMQIFRQVAESGKTVVCITHNLTNVEKSCHKVVILAPGGYLAFVGTPEEARQHFEIESLGDVYQRLQDKPALEWKSQFEQTSISRGMQEVIQDRLDQARDRTEVQQQQSRLQAVAIFFRQWLLLARRGIEVQWADQKSLVMMGVQCLFIGFLICLLFGQIPESGLLGFGQRRRMEFSQTLLFLLTISSYWFGCNNAAKEIVKDKEIYERERDVCLNVFSYYAAKFLLLAALTVGQIVALVIMVKMVSGLPGSLLLQLASLSLVGICGVATGLFISTVASNTDMAVTLVPVAIIPQVILAGAIWTVDGLAKILAAGCISVYWSYGNLLTTLPDALLTDPYDDWTFLGSGVMVVMHVVLLVGLANGLLHAADKRLSLKGTGVEAWLKNARGAIHGALESVSTGSAGDPRG